VKNDNVPMSATYFREYGIHPVKQHGDTDYIASFPSFDETIGALKSHLPYSGNVITPEYITAPDNLSEIRNSAKLIDDRIRTAVDLTKRTDAVLHLGTPTHTTDPHGNTKWLNSVLSIQRGAIRSSTHKQTPLPAERTLGIEYPTEDRRRVMKNGAAVLICAELFLYALDPKNKLRDQNVRQIYAPTMWATPAIPGQNLGDIQKAGSEDTYYRNQLERAVGSYLFRGMPTVDRVIISDRGRPDVAPYNAIFDRTR
jgi:hypothetical protein